MLWYFEKRHLIPNMLEFMHSLNNGIKKTTKKTKFILFTLTLVKLFFQKEKYRTKK